MENKTKNIYDITYVSELILDIIDVKDLIRTITYSRFGVRKLCAHKTRGICLDQI